MGQMLVEGAALEANLRRAETMIASAARQSCDLIVLPECLDTGWTDPSTHTLAQPIPGPTSGRLASAARANSIHVVAGITERDGARLYNTAILLDGEGTILATHRKINELDIALDLYTRGNALAVTNSNLGQVGLTICADNWPSSLCLGHSLGRMGAQLMPSPCAWAVDSDHDNALNPYGGEWLSAYEELAREHGVTVIGVSNVGPITAGPWKGRKCIGSSLAVGPNGILARGPYNQECFLVFDVL